MSGIRYASGRNRLIGFGQKLTSIAALDPARYEGAALYYEGDFLYSDGEQWKIPTETRPIVRPSALVPTNAAEQAQLRLTEFLSPLGLQQTSVVFEVSLSGDFENDRLFQRVSTDPNASVYDILYPDDGIAPGQAFFWRGLYTATGGQQSDWSSAYRQVYPDLITPPVPLTRPFAITATLAISPYESIFGLNYIDTEFEIYNATGVTEVASVTTTTGGSANLPEGLEAGISYSWRARYRGRVGLAGTIVASRWTTLRPFVNATNTILLTYDLSKGSAGSTITLPLGLHTVPGALPTVTNVTIDWGDNAVQTVTSNGAVSHSYNLATDLAGMFATCHRFNQPLASWNTANVTTMASMFDGADAFDQNIGAWNTSRVRSFSGMFNEANGFNNGGSAAIGSWNTAACTDFSYMFQITNSTHPFNQPIGAWDVSKATTLRGMFHNRGFGTSAFDQDISTWRLNRDGVDLAEFGITNLSRVNYSKLLTAWGNLVFDQQGPFAAALFTEGVKIYDSTVYAPGDAFETAIAARSFLVAPAQITISGASVPTANGVYLLTGGQFRKADGWYLANSSVTWTLFDNLGNVQASGNAPPEGFNGPSRVTAWSGVLAGASVLRTGAAWTITGDTQQ